MQERVIENWLTKVNERSFEIPFCQLLIGEGYELIHLSRHGPFEEGKDVIAIDPDGTPCAFQLKSGGKLTQSEWANYIDQVNRLVEIPIKHPSIDPKKPRRVFFVTTGELEEEVRTEIDSRNIDWKNREHPQLETLVKGQLLQRFISLQTNLWPSTLSFEKDMLEFFLADGTSYIDKKKLSTFLMSLVPINEEEPQRAYCKRSLASSAIISSYCLSPFEEQQNHVALIEGWVIYLSSLIALAEKHGLERNIWQDSFDICIYAINQAFENLCSELQEREHLIEGNPLVDPPFYRGRITWLVSLMAWWSLHENRNAEWKYFDWCHDFIISNKSKLLLWGEAAIPQLIAIYWFLATSNSIAPDKVIYDAIQAICYANYKLDGFADPYHELPEVVSDNLLPHERLQKESYKDRSYMLHGLVSLFAKKGWRGAINDLWPIISRIQMTEFIVDTPWHFCLWESETGVLKTYIPKRTQSWKELVEKSSKVNDAVIPAILSERPELLLLFTIVFPHRFTKDVAVFLDNYFLEET